MEVSGTTSLSPCRALIPHPLHASPSPIAALLRSLSPSPTQPLCLLDFTCDETVGHVLSFLDGPSLCSARSVCRSWRRLSADDQLWLNLCLNECHVCPTQLSTRPESYEELYQVASRSLKRLLRDYLHEQCLANLQNSLRIPRAAALTLIASRAAL